MYRHEAHGGLNRPKFDVLIVEDEPISRKALLALISAKGYQADAAPSGEDALKRSAQNGVPMIALVDLELPGMNGIELIKRLEALNPRVFPVLITAAPGDLVESIRAQHPVEYLRKPLDFDRLMSILSERRTAHS
jgi:CheY-like chemotaxis protein